MPDSPPKRQEEPTIRLLDMRENDQWNDWLIQYALNLYWLFKFNQGKHSIKIYVATELRMKEVNNGTEVKFPKLFFYF